MGGEHDLRAELARVRAQLALQTSLLTSVIESAPTTIASADLAGNLIFISKGPNPNVLGKLAWHHVLPEDRARARECFEAVIQSGEQQTYEARGESGIRWRVQVGPRFEAGHIVGATFVAWDVSEQIALESRVAIADRMASIGALAAGVAHEINNPLTYVLANVEWAARTSAERHDSVAVERLQAALEGIARIRSVVSDLSTFSRVDCDAKQLLDVHALLDTALRMAQTETRYRARVIRRYEATAPVLASEARLGQVFLNLVVNAAQALPEGDAQRNEITVATSMTSCGRVQVEISDTGVGIAPELLGRVFDPFVTTKPRGVGTGLGLHICRNVVTALGGEICVRSQLGVGTTFRVALPAAEKTLLESRWPDAIDFKRHPPSQAVARLRVLIADDEPDVGEVFKRYLEEHHVEVVHSGRMAIERLTTSDYDVAFCDLIMPDLTGMDVFELLKERRPGAERRVVFMTGGPFTERAQRFLTSLENAVLHKPFTFDEIRDILANLRTQAATA